MLRFAENEFELSALQADGATLRQVYQSVEKQIGRKPDEYVELTCPTEAQSIWNAFVELSGSRHRDGMGGIGSISYTEMLAYSKLRQFELSPHDVTTLKALDNAYLNNAAKQLAKNKQST